MNLHRDSPGLRQRPSLKSGRSINELVAPAFRAPQLHGKSPVRSLCHAIFISHAGQYGPLQSGPPVCKPNDRHSRAANTWEDVSAMRSRRPTRAYGATRTPNGSEVRSVRKRSEAQGLNVLSCKTKVRKLFIIKLSEPRPYPLLPGIVVSLNKSAHQARPGFQVPGRACGHASPQKLEVHDRLLFFLQRETEACTRAGGRTSWACGALCRYERALFQRQRDQVLDPFLRPMRTHHRGGARRPMSCKARVHV